ncbi:MAG TPA: lysylphosphatidylglycerol synthase transmembrane domain-containing protein [Candidatus Bipolaricaulota bacterium]
MSKGIKRRITIAVSILTGLVLMVATIYSVGLDRIWNGMIQLGWLGAGLSFLNILAMVFGWVWTWKLLLNAYGIFPSWLIVWRAVLGGYALTYLTPSMYFGGEPLRVYLLSKETGADSSQVTATVVLWKLLEGATLFSFVLLGSVNAIFSGVLPVSQEVSIVVGNVLIIGGWALLAWSFITKRHWCSRTCGFLERKLHWARERLHRIREWLVAAESGIHAAFVHHGRTMWQVLGLCLLINITTFIRPWIFFQFSADYGFSFRELSFIFALFFFLSTFLWLTPGGIGISELGLIGIFQLVNGVVPAQEAVAYSLTIKSMELVFIILGISVMVHFGVVHLPRLKRN